MPTRLDLPTAVLLAVLAGVPVSGCKSPQEKCAQAQDEATRAWKAYVAVLETAREKALKTQRDTTAALTTDIEKRMSEKAKAKASELYDQGDGAWQRAYNAAYNTACREDEECSRAKLGNAQARKDAAELLERLQAARAAKEAARGDAAKARLAADKVADDYANRELVKAARAVSEAASLACREVKP
jgi:hypothetical protein